MDEVNYCSKCGEETEYAPGIGSFCPNSECETVDGPFAEDIPSIEELSEVTGQTVEQLRKDANAFSKDSVEFDERERRILRKKFKKHRHETDEHYHLYQKLIEWSNE